MSLLIGPSLTPTRTYIIAYQRMQQPPGLLRTGERDVSGVTH